MPSPTTEEAQPRVAFSSASRTVLICAGSIGSALLKEDGFAILLETGDELLKEQV